MATHTTFRGFSNYWDAGLSETLEQNLLLLTNWAFAGMGAFAVVEKGASGWYGGDQSRLRLSEDPNYTKGQVWEGFRRDWVWETGVDYSSQPVRTSGVYVNNTFYPVSTTGAYAHVVDYPNGRVIFSSAINPSSTVQANFTYRYTHVTTADDPIWREVQTYSLRADDSHFLQYGSGVWSTSPMNRLQLPAVIIKASPNLHIRSVNIGGSNTVVQQSVDFFILAETDRDRKQLHDIFSRQWAKRFNLFDVNRVYAVTGYPLDANGSPVVSGKMYPEMVAPYTDGGYGSTQLRVEGISSAELPMQNYGGLEGAVVRWTCEVDMVG